MPKPPEVFPRIVAAFANDQGYWFRYVLEPGDYGSMETLAQQHELPESLKTHAAEIVSRPHHPGAYWTTGYGWN